MPEQHKPATPPPAPHPAAAAPPAAKPPAAPAATPKASTAPPPVVGQARSAETKEQSEAAMKEIGEELPLPGSRNYVAGQPVDEEERDRTEAEATALGEAGKKAREKEDKEIADRIAENAKHNPMRDEPRKAERDPVQTPRSEPPKPNR